VGEGRDEGFMLKVGTVLGEAVGLSDGATDGVDVGDALGLMDVVGRKDKVGMDEGIPVGAALG